jgi:protein tyrosine kinase modulator
MPEMPQMIDANGVMPPTRGGSVIDAVLSALAVASRRRRLAAVILCTLLAGVVTLAVSLPRMYRSTVTLLIEHREVAPEGGGPAGSSDDLETRLQLITEDVLSRGRLETLMDRFDLYPEMRRRDREAAVRQLRSDIQIKLKAESGADRPATVASA